MTALLIFYSSSWATLTHTHAWVYWWTQTHTEYIFCTQWQTTIHYCPPVIEMPWDMDSSLWNCHYHKSVTPGKYPWHGAKHSTLNTRKDGKQSHEQQPRPWDEHWIPSTATTIQTIIQRIALNISTSRPLNMRTNSIQFSSLEKCDHMLSLLVDGSGSVGHVKINSFKIHFIVLTSKKLHHYHIMRNLEMSS